MKIHRIAILWSASILFAATGCGGGEEAEVIETLSATPFSVRTVEWNPSAVDVGNPIAVGELGGTSVIFSNTGASIFSGGILVAADANITDWKSAAIFPAADGNGMWIAGLSQSGKAYRLRGGSYFEGISDLYGLEMDSILGAAALGGPSIAFALEGQLAIADGMNITRYDIETFGGIAGSTGRAASAGTNKVNAFKAAAAEHSIYELGGAEQVVFDASGRMVVRTADSIYLEAQGGGLVLRYKSPGPKLRELVASDVRVWFIEGTELGALEADAVYISEGAGIADNAHLLGSPSGDVWMVDGSPKLTRYAAETGDSEDRKGWEEKVQPIYIKSCTPCHEPGGSSGADLSTYGAWVARRTQLQDEVITKKTMPPQGIEFSDMDRTVLGDWISAAPK